MSITTEQFDAQVQQQIEQQNKKMLWHELQVGAIYTIVGTKLLDAKYGESCILFLSDETKVLAPRVLMRLLKRENKPFPRYVKPKGQWQSKNKPVNTYYAFDLVLKKHPLQAEPYKN